MNTMNHATLDAYLHVRVIIGIILGLSLSKLLSGLAGFVQHPSRQRIYPTHLIWVFFALLSLVHFWWFEFYLASVAEWTFGLYLLVIFYSSLYYLLAALLFPDKLDDYAGYRDYFMSRRKWFFSLLALIFVVDLADTAIKGHDHFASFGLIYPARNIAYVAMAIAAAFIPNRRTQMMIAILALTLQALWIWREFSTL